MREVQVFHHFLTDCIQGLAKLKSINENWKFEWLSLSPSIFENKLKQQLAKSI